MAKKRHYHNAELKAKVALLAIKGDLTTAQLSSKYRVDASQITRWKRELSDSAAQVFSNKKDSDLSAKEEEVNVLYRQVGKLTIQNEFLREKLKP